MRLSCSKGTSVLLAVAFLLLVAGSFSEVVMASNVSGPELLRQVDETMGSDSRTMSQRMTLFSASGQQRTRELMMQNKRTATEDNMLARFLAPADVRGTGLLMAQDDMWLYLPALGRSRRIAGHAKQGDFMGSDFSYKDMEQFGSVGFGVDYQAELHGMQELAEEAVYVLELLPKNEEVDYARLNMLVDKERLIPRKIEYFDQEGSLWKVLTTDDLKEVDGRWVAHRIEMQDVQKGTKTVLEVTEVEFGVDIPDSVFTTRHLERGI